MAPDDHIILYKRAGTGWPKRELREFALRLRTDVAGDRSYTVLLTDDRELQRLNTQFLGKNHPTDVLSFPAGDQQRAGDVAISVERAREQAAEYGHDAVDEIKVLMLHGVLHLLGMDHATDRGSMARTEKLWRKKLGLSAGLIERARQ